MLTVQEEFDPAESNQVVDSQEMPNLAASITVLSAPSNDYVFDVPDGLEQDPEIIRAELLFMNTPQTEAYSAEAYDTLKNIQAQCAFDYQKFCGPTTATAIMSVQDVQSIQDMMDFVMSPEFLLNPSMNIGRKLHADNSYSARSYLNYFRSFYLQNAAGSILGKGPRKAQKERSNKINGNNVVHDNVVKIQKVQNLADSESKAKEKRAGFRRLRMDHHMGNMADHGHGKFDEHDRDRDRKDPKQDPSKEPPKDPRGPPSKEPPKDSRKPPSDEPKDPRKDPHGPPRGPPPPPPGRDYDSDSDDEDDDHHRGPHGHHGPRSHYWEDHSFAGALGYGASGDMCMYQHAAQLSPPCVNAVVDLYALRQEYWQQHVQTTAHPHSHFGMFLIGGLLLLALVKRACTWKKRKAVRDLVAGLHADPELKATVESRLGITVPELKCCAKSNGGCFFKRCLCTLAFIVFTLITSFFISFTSLEMTSAIVEKMDRDNEGEPASPLFALMLLFFFITVQVTGVVFIMRKVKEYYMKHYGGCNGGDASCPSAPCAEGKCPIRQPNATGSPAATPARSTSSWHEWISPRITAMSNSFNIFGRRRNGTTYQPLLNQDDATEMIAVGTAYDHSQHGATQPRVAIYTGVPLNANQIHATIVPVTATPVNTVSFV